MLLNLTDLSDEPLHGQISRQIRAQILKGQLAPETPLPSIRGLAKEQRVSVITVQRAYEDLEREGLIVARRGKGFFTARLRSRQLTRRAQARARQTLDKAVRGARADGLDAQQIRDIVNALLNDGNE